MTVHDTQAPRTASAGGILLDDVTASPAADWADHVLACAAAYRYRLTSEGDVELRVAGLPGPLRLRVEPTTTLAELVERVRAARTSPVAAEAVAAPGSTQVLLDAGPVTVDDLALVLTLDADGRLDARARATRSATATRSWRRTPTVSATSPGASWRPDRQPRWAASSCSRLPSTTRSCTCGTTPRTRCRP